MTTNIGGGRALHVCDLCGGVDDHPRHSLLGGEAGAHPEPSVEIVRTVAAAVADQDQATADRLLTELLDTGTTDRHLDCCRAAGCPTGDCDRRTVGAEELRGAELLDHLIGAGL
jgi:hypothetical protein